MLISFKLIPFPYLSFAYTGGNYESKNGWILFVYLEPGIDTIGMKVVVTVQSTKVLSLRVFHQAN
jgi:hypothetical protein